MAEGIEIVIDPKKLMLHGIYLTIIIALAVLLIIKWNAAANCTPIDRLSTQATAASASASSQAAQEAQATQEEDLCANRIKDQDETDVDCGGSNCDPCAEFKACNVNADCEAGWCRDNMKCVTPTCEDGVKNKDELNIDCGGHCKATKGEFYYDGACHKEVKPLLSGEVGATVSARTSLNDAYLIRIDTVTINVSNGLDIELVGATAAIYATGARGAFPGTSTTGEVRVLNYPDPPIAITTLAPGKSFTKTLNISKTLTETDDSDRYSLRLEIRDSRGSLLKEATWEKTGPTD